MDPVPLRPEQWDLIARAINGLFLFVGLGVNAALAFLLAHAIIPSIVRSGEAPPDILVFRRVLYPVFAISLALTFHALWRGLSLAVLVLQQVYPRFAI
jgi:hypothetical protein